MAIRRSVLRLVVVLQVFLLVTSLIAPVAAFAEEPSADPNPSPTSSAEPSAEPTPEATPEATPSEEPSSEPTAEPTAEPTPDATPESPAPTPEPTPEPSPVASVGAPTIASDHADYPPGALVTLTGSNFQPGEVVHIFVNDDWGSSWNRHADVTAAENGTITDQFNLPDWFVARYSVVASGSASGIATTSFTDGAVRVRTRVGTTNLLVTFQAHSVDVFTPGTNITCTGAASSESPGAAFSTTTAGNGYSANISGLTVSSGSFSITAPATATDGTTTYPFSGWVSDDTANAIHKSTVGTTGCFQALTPGLIQLTAIYTSNVAPVVTPPANQSANEGSSTSVSLGSFTDAAADTPWAVSVDWGDGSTDTSFSAAETGSLGSQSHTYADGPASRTVTVTVTDKNGASGPATFSVVVANLPPTITAVTAVPDPVNEGSPTTVTVSATDPAGAADPLTYGFDCDNNGTYEISQLADNDATCTFDDGPATRTIGVRVSDGDGGADTDVVDVDVDNVAPTATFANGGSVNEGSTGSVSFTNQDDASSADEGAGFSYSYDFNNDGTFEITDSASDSITVPASYLADGPGSRTVKARIKDKDGGFTDYMTTITILNLPPTITAVTAVPDPVNEGSPTTVTVSATDPAGAADPLTYGFDCDNNGTYEISQLADNDATCTFDDGPATRTIGVRVSDGDGGADTDVVDVDVDNVAPTIASLTVSPSAVVSGQSVTVFGTATDPSGADTTAGFDWRFKVGAAAWGGYGNSASLTSPINTCGPVVIQAQARDKDNGESAVSTVTVQSYGGTFLSPLKEGMANLVQKGRVVPVQISFTDCAGMHIAGLQPEIQLLKGDFVANAGTETSAENMVTVSVSGADTGNVMREQTSKYSYNLSIPSSGLSAGQALTVRVRPFGSNTQPTMYILLEIRK